MRAKRQFIDVKTGQLHLRAAGRASSRPAILCLHLMPKSGRVFAPLLPALAEDRLAIAPDFPGCGESDPFHSGQKPSILDYADAIEEVIAHFGLKQVDLVGYHTGSIVAAELALRHPRTVRKAIHISAPIFTDQELQEFRQQFSPIPLDEAGTRFRTLWEWAMQHRGPGMTLEMAALSMAESLRGGERYEEGHEAAFNHCQAYAQTLGKIEQPLLVMNIGDDLYEHSKRADRLFRNGRRIDFPQWGSGFLEIWPGEAAAVMLEFFNAEDGQGDG